METLPWERPRSSPYLLLFSCSVVSDSLCPRGLQHARLACPSLSSWAWLNSCPFSPWCHPTISSSVGHVWLGSMGDSSILYSYVLTLQDFLLPDEGRVEVAIFMITWWRREQVALCWLAQTVDVFLVYGSVFGDYHYKSTGEKSAYTLHFLNAFCRSLVFTQK